MTKLLIRGKFFQLNKKQWVLYDTWCTINNSDYIDEIIYTDFRYLIIQISLVNYNFSEIS